MEEVRAHAQVYQDRSLREAQNSVMSAIVLSINGGRCKKEKIQYSNVGPEAMLLDALSATMTYTVLGP